jgi:hypothetical protein
VPDAIGAQNETSFSIFLDTGFRRLHRISFVVRAFARSTTIQKTAWSEISAVCNKGPIRFGQQRVENPFGD